MSQNTQNGTNITITILKITKEHKIIIKSHNITIRTIIYKTYDIYNDTK
jgi:hypothetical protein